MIKIQNLKKIYNGNTVLDIDNLDIGNYKFFISN